MRPSPSPEDELFLAGAVGFEPTNAGIKTRCLKPLGDAPIFGATCGIRIRVPGLKVQAS